MNRPGRSSEAMTMVGGMVPVPRTAGGWETAGSGENGDANAVGAGAQRLAPPEGEAGGRPTPQFGVQPRHGFGVGKQCELFLRLEHLRALLEQAFPDLVKILPDLLPMSRPFPQQADVDRIDVGIEDRAKQSAIGRRIRQDCR